MDCSIIAAHEYAKEIFQRIKFNNFYVEAIVKSTAIHKIRCQPFYSGYYPKTDKAVIRRPTEFRINNG